MTLRGVKALLEANTELFIRAYVYGSVARGQEDEASDVDLLLVRNTEREFFDRIREVMGLVSELGAVDLLIYTPEELNELVEKRRNGFLAELIAKGVTVEGRQSRGAALAPAG
jgi:predicted nucleotidyltransferase